MYREEDQEQEGRKESRGAKWNSKAYSVHLLIHTINRPVGPGEPPLPYHHPHPILIQRMQAHPHEYTNQVFLSTTHLQTCCLPVRSSAVVLLLDISWYHLGPSLATNRTRLIHRVTSGHTQNPDSIIRESSRWRRPISDPFHGHDTKAIRTRLSAIARLVLCAQHTLGPVRGSYVSSKVFRI